MSGLAALWLFYGLAVVGVLLGFALPAFVVAAACRWRARRPRRVLRPTQVASIAYPSVNGVFIRELR